MDSLEQRQAVITEAETWLRTPFHHEARVKGGGVDCAMLLAEVYHATRVVPFIEPLRYSQQWHLHRGEEKYLPWVEKFAVEIMEKDVRPADIAMFRIGRAWSHGGIIYSWPTIIHAWYATCVEYSDASKEPLQSYPRKFFTLREWAI